MKKTWKTGLILCLLLVLVLSILAIMVGVISFLRLDFGATESVRIFGSGSRLAGSSHPEEEIRVAAEWEPALGALVRWPLMVPKALVVEIARDDTLFLLVENETGRSEAEKDLASWGIDLRKVRFILAEQGDAHPWTRDWGPHARFTEAGEYSLVDPWFDDYPLSDASCGGRLYSLRRWTFRDFTRDDLATEVLAKALGFARVRVPFALTGGNVMMDGHGTAFSTCAMLNENRTLGLTDDEFIRTVRRHMGISRYVMIPNFELFGIQHIDCFLKLLDEERILVARPPEGHSHYERSEEIVRALSSLTNAYGRPYKIIRIDTPPYWLDFMPAYTNSLILNRKVLVPLFGIPADEEALETWRKAMPGYEVIGFEHQGNWLERWAWFDALHCRSRAIWDPEMLYMTHKRIDETVAPAKAYRIEVRIRDYSRAGLIREALNVSWRLKGEQRWQSIPLEATAKPGSFVASIPGTDAGQGVEYFVSAADHSGRRESLPRTAPKGYYSFEAIPK